MFNALNAFSSSIGSLVSEQPIAPYQVINRYKGFEERVYESSAWACTEQRGEYRDQDQISVFLGLFAYINGENDKGINMGMSTPVSIYYDNRGSSQLFEACFYVHPSQQNNPPEPTNNNVFIRTRPSMTVYTREFGGFATDQSDWLSEARKLTRMVEAAGKSVQTDVMFWNAYDAPVKFWNRRNEVWLLKIEE